MASDRGPDRIGVLLDHLRHGNRITRNVNIVCRRVSREWRGFGWRFRTNTHHHFILKILIQNRFPCTRQRTGTDGRAQWSEFYTLLPAAPQACVAKPTAMDHRGHGPLRKRRHAPVFVCHLLEKQKCQSRQKQQLRSSPASEMDRANAAYIRSRASSGKTGWFMGTPSAWRDAGPHAPRREPVLSTGLRHGRLAKQIHGPVLDARRCQRRVVDHRVAARYTRRSDDGVRDGHRTGGPFEPVRRHCAALLRPELHQVESRAQSIDR